MKVEDSLKAMSAVEGLYDGSEASAAKVAYLNKELIERPETFWDSYFSVCNPPSTEVERLLRTGKITDSTTFADLAAVLEKDGTDAA